MAVRLLPGGLEAHRDRLERPADPSSLPTSDEPLPVEAPAEPGADVTRLLADLDDRFTSVSRAVRRVREHADDEAVHDLRVASRRLIAAIDMWSEVLRRRPADALRRRLRRLRRRAGEVRDLEVHVERLRDLREALEGPPRELAVYVLGGLEPEAARAVARIGRRMRGRSVRRLAERYGRATRDLRMPAIVTVATLSARTELSRRALMARAALRAALDSGQPELLHAARVEVKKWRYAAESLDAVLGADAPATAPSVQTAADAIVPENATAPLRVLRRLQQALGRIQDSATLAARLESALPAGGSRAALLAELSRDSAASLAQVRALSRELPS